MPQGSKSKTNPLTKYDVLNGKLSQLHQGVTALERRNVAQKRPNTYNKAPSKSIPRPNGQAGRKRGFNLQNILGMDENKNKYNLFLNTIRRLATRYLDLKLPLRQQEYDNVAKVIALAQREWPYLTQYAQGWPIREHLSRYLINHRNYSKKIQSFESDENEDTDGGDVIEENDAMEDDIGNELTTAPSSKTTLRKRPLVASSNTEDAEEEPQMSKRRRVGNEANRRRNIAGDDAGAQGDVEDGMEPEDDAIEQVPLAAKNTNAAKKTAAKSRTKTKASVAKATQAPFAKTTQTSAAIATSQTITSKKATASKTRAKTSTVPNTRSVAKKKAASDTNTSKTPFKMVFKPGTLIDQNKGAAQITTTESIMPRVARKAANISKRSQPTNQSDDDNPEQNPNDEEDNIDEVALPTSCPICDDEIPHSDNHLRGLFKEYNYIVNTAGEFSRQGLMQQMTICNYVKGSANAIEARAFAESHGWPIEIDFTKLPDRIVRTEMKNKLDQLVADGLVSDNPIQNQFNKDLKALYPNGNGLKMLNEKTTPERIRNNAKPGYYGAKGNAVILSTIYRLLDPMAFTTTEAIAPLRFTIYATYVLVPYIAHLLISEDLDCTPEDAYKIMLDSQETGAMLYPEHDDDDELDDIFRENSRSARIEKAKAIALREGQSEARKLDTNGRPLPRMVKTRP